MKIILSGSKINLTIGELLPGMDVPAIIINDRAMVPLRFISEYFGANVIYHRDTRSIDIFR